MHRFIAKPDVIKTK